MCNILDSEQGGKQANVQKESLSGLQETAGWSETHFSTRSWVFHKVRLTEQMLYLQDVISWLHVCDVDPLAVDVVPVRVPAADCDALRAKVGTFVPFLYA